MSDTQAVAQSLFDKPAVRTVRDLGAPIAAYVTESGGVVKFERGEMHFTNEQFNYFRNTFARVEVPALSERRKR